MPDSLGIIDDSDVLSGIGSTTRTPAGHQHSLEDALSLDEDSDDAADKEADGSGDLPIRESTVPLVLPLGILLPRSPARLFVHYTTLQSAFGRSGNTSPLVTNRPESRIWLQGEVQIVMSSSEKLKQPEQFDKQMPDSNLNSSEDNSLLLIEESIIAPPESEVDLEEEREIPDDVQPTFDWDEQISENLIHTPEDLDTGNVGGTSVPTNDIMMNADQQQEIQLNVETVTSTTDTTIESIYIETLDAVVVNDILDEAVIQPSVPETTGIIEDLVSSTVTWSNEDNTNIVLETTEESPQQHLEDIVQESRISEEKCLESFELLVTDTTTAPLVEQYEIEKLLIPDIKEKLVESQDSIENTIPGADEIQPVPTETNEAVVEPLNIVTSSSEKNLNTTEEFVESQRETNTTSGEENDMQMPPSEQVLDILLHTTQDLVELPPEINTNLEEETEMKQLQIPISEDHRDSGLCELIVRCDSRDETYVMYTSEDEFLSPNSESGGYHTPTVTLQDELEGDSGKSINLAIQSYSLT